MKHVCRRFGLSTFWFVDVLVCRRFGLSTFWSVDVLVCRRFGLSTFWFVDVSVCRRFGLSTFRFVDVSVCRRFGCRRFGLSTFWPVTTQTHRQTDAGNDNTRRPKLASGKNCKIALLLQCWSAQLQSRPLLLSATDIIFIISQLTVNYLYFSAMCMWTNVTMPYAITFNIHPWPKIMADFFQTQKLTWCHYPICTIFSGCIKCMQVFIFCAKYIDFLHQPVLHRGSKCGKRHIFQIKFEHHR